MRIELVGIGFIIIGLVVLALAGLQEGSVKYGGVVMLGPIPLIFGNSKSLILVASGLVLITLILILLTKM